MPFGSTFTHCKGEVILYIFTVIYLTITAKRKTDTKGNMDRACTIYKNIAHLYSGTSLFDGHLLSTIKQAGAIPSSSHLISVPKVIEKRVTLQKRFYCTHKLM